MKWIDFKSSGEKPKEGSWVLIQSSLPNVPKYEVCIFDSDEWYIPANDEVCNYEDVVKWCYIELDEKNNRFQTD